MRRFFFLLPLAVLALSGAAFGQLSAPPPGALYHVVGGESATLFRTADSSSAYVELAFQEPVRAVEETDESWREVRTRDGARGFVRASALSNVWIRVAKRERAVQVYRGTRLVRTMAADLGNNAFADKEQRGGTLAPDQWRTPEGRFFVVDKNPQSRFHRALVLNYPTAEDAHRGLRKGIISRSEFEAITEADEEHRRPPMDTALGGLIELHGDGTGGGTNWTHGCVALRNPDIDWLWRHARVGTPVVIER